MSLPRRAAGAGGGIPVHLVEGPLGDEVSGEARRRRFAPGGNPEVTTTSTWIVRLALIGATVAYLLVVAPWGWRLLPKDHAGASEPLTQSAPATPPTNALRMGPVSTGIIAVDDAVRGFLKGDVAEAHSQLVVQQVRCGILPWGGAPALACAAAQAPGTVREMVLSACGAKWVTAEAARAEFTTLLADTPGLYAVSQVSGGYSAVLTWPNAPNRSLVLKISSVSVTWYGTGCGLPLVPNDGHELLFATSGR